MSTPTNLSRLEALPMELRKEILSAAADPNDVAALALSCSSMFLAFQDAPTTISSTVVQPWIEEMKAMDLLPEVIVEYESQKLRHHWYKDCWIEVFQFSQDHLDNRPEIAMPLHWDFAKAKTIVSMYKIIRDFARDFATRALGRRPLIIHGYDPEPNEVARIMRAFYIFQVICNMFRGPHIVDVWEFPDGCLSLLKHLVLDKLVPHESEQLACVLDYLFDFVSPAFDDIAAHDFCWGYRHVEYGGELTDRKRCQIQAILARGLPKLHPLLHTKDYVRRNEVINPGVQGPATASCWLYQALTEINDQPLRNRHLQYFQDPVHGPYHAWWAARNGLVNSIWQFGPCVNVPSLFLNRRWGYVMWNSRRFTRIPYGVQSTPLEKPLHNPPYVPKPMPLNRFWSWMARTRLYIEDWRGRWNGAV